MLGNILIAMVAHASFAALGASEEAPFDNDLRNCSFSEKSRSGLENGWEEVVQSGYDRALILEFLSELRSRPSDIFCVTPMLVVAFDQNGDEIPIVPVQDNYDEVRIYYRGLELVGVNVPSVAMNAVLQSY